MAKGVVFKEKVLEITCDNWTDDKTRIKFNVETGKFFIQKLAGFSFQLTLIDEDNQLFSITSPQWPENYELGHVWMDGVDRSGNATYTASDLSRACQRTADNKFAAAAKLLCNTV